MFVCFDDILVFSKSSEERARHLRIALDILQLIELYTKSSKCELNKPELQFLGHIVGRHGITMILLRQLPSQIGLCQINVHQLRSFLGLATHLRRIVQGFSRLVITSLMTDLTKVKVPWV